MNVVGSRHLLQEHILFLNCEQRLRSVEVEGGKGEGERLRSVEVIKSVFLYNHP